MTPLPVGVAEYEPTEGVALIVRAHHTANISLVGELGVNGVVEAAQAGAAAEAARGNPMMGSYYERLYGSPGRAEVVNNSIRELLETFVAQPDEAIIQVVTHKKDGICNGCADEHCLTPMSLDEDYLRAILETSEALGMTLKPEQRSAVDTLGRAILITAVNLTAGQARRIFDEEYFHFRAIPNQLERALAIHRYHAAIGRSRPLRAL